MKFSRKVNSSPRSYLKILFVSIFLSQIIQIFSSREIPAQAAERINFTYNSIPISITTQDLDNFSKNNKTSESFEFYINHVSPEQRKSLLEFLTTNYGYSPLVINRVLQEPMAAHVLRRIGDLIKTPFDKNGSRYLKIALLKSAASPKGFTTLDVIRNFPYNIELDVESIVKINRESQSLKKETQDLTSRIKRQADKEARTESIPNFKLLPNLKMLGRFRYGYHSLSLYDRSRKREYKADVYVPIENKSHTIPIIIIENGLGGKLNRLDYLAKYLASHGFAVAISGHPGSDDQKEHAFIHGSSNEVLAATEFIDRPRDVSYLLDELGRLNHSKFKDTLRINDVGVIGFSLGGTTALALGGSTINFKKLEQDCGSNLNLNNLSLFFQCRTLALPRKTYSLKDPRVKSLFVLFPFSRSIYGNEGMKQITIPVLWQVLVDDNTTPMVLEQVPSFNELGSQNKYLTIVSGFAHFDLKFMQRSLSKKFKGDEKREPEQIKSGLNQFSLAFFKTYLEKDNRYLPWLQSAAVKAMSKNSPFGVEFIKSLPATELSVSESSPEIK
jgi:predicted dienelactone hydrolase